MSSKWSMSSQRHDMRYKYTVLSSNKPNNMHFETAVGDFKKRFYNHSKSFHNETSAHVPTLWKYIWEQKEILNLNSTLVCYIAKTYHLIQIHPRSVYCTVTKNLK